MYDWLNRIFSSSKTTPLEMTAAPVTEVACAATAPGVASEQPVSEPQPTTPSATGKFSKTSWLQRSDLNAAFTDWLFARNVDSDIFTSQIEKDILAALDAIVNSSQSGANLVRRMPGVIPQLLQSLRSDDFSGAELARRISVDVVLVAAVIRIANSSVYNPGKPITSIEHAVLVLGQAGLRQLITSVAFRPIIDLQSGHFTKTIAPRLWEQSEKCAIANRLLATGTGADPFEAFLAGLLKDVGLIVSLRVIDQMSDGKQPIGSESFCNALINYGRILSCSIGREWHFPQAVTTAIEEQGEARNAAISAAGKILASGDYLSKMHFLNSQHRLPDHLAAYIDDLSDNERQCLHELNQAQESPA